MATEKTQFATNDNKTRKKWARDLFKKIPHEVEYNYLVGSSEDSIVQLRTELGKGEGDEITFAIVRSLQEDGQVGRETVEGNEEMQRFRDFKMTIEELNKAVDTGGKMEAQRVPIDLMKTGRKGLQEWWGQRLSELLIWNLAGHSAAVFNGRLMSSTTNMFANVIPEPDLGHALAVGQTVSSALTTSEAAITAQDMMTLRFLDGMKQRAENPYNSNCYKVRPLKLKGKNYFRVLMHNFVFDQLRINTDAGEWGDLQRRANKLQIPSVEIEYNGMLITKSDKLPQTVVDTTDTTSRSGVYRTILLGCQAACWAWGGAGESKGSIMSFVPYEKDAKRFVMIRGGGILGMKVARFDGYDYGKVVGSSYAKPLV